MRAIKFRAWDTSKKRMVYETQEHANRDGLTVGSSIHSHVYEIGLGFGTLMQFTGLKDKNGVEIYQSDIIECVGERYTVDWHFNRWVMRNDKGKISEFNKLSFEAGWYEVVGNTYEN